MAETIEFLRSMPRGKFATRISTFDGLARGKIQTKISRTIAEIAAHHHQLDDDCRARQRCLPRNASFHPSSLEWENKGEGTEMNIRHTANKLVSALVRTSAKLPTENWLNSLQYLIILDGFFTFHCTVLSFSLLLGFFSSFWETGRIHIWHRVKEKRTSRTWSWKTSIPIRIE